MTVVALVDYLKTQSAKGVSHVYLSQDARDAVRSAIQANKKAQPSKLPPEIKPSLQTARTQVAVESRPRERQSPAASVPVSNQAVAPESVSLDLPEGTQQDQIAALRKLAESWSPAHSLGTLRQRLVFSAGNSNADLMIIGDAPGFDDEVARTPFSGKAGHKLNQILKAMTLKREGLYLTNICKYRPSSPRQTTDNRKPTPQEIAACLPLLRKEIEVVQPKCLLVLGATATQALLPSATADVAAARGAWQKYMGIPMLPSFHPTYLLRNESNTVAKRKLWEDMLLVMEHLSVQISAKQRGYFSR